MPLAKESTWLQLAGANGCILKNCEFWPCQGHLRGLQSSWKLVAATSFRSTCKPETGSHWDPTFRTMGPMIRKMHVASAAECRSSEHRSLSPPWTEHGVTTPHVFDPTKGASPFIYQLEKSRGPKNLWIESRKSEKSYGKSWYTNNWQQFPSHIGKTMAKQDPLAANWSYTFLPCLRSRPFASHWCWAFRAATRKSWQFHVKIMMVEVCVVLTRHFLWIPRIPCCFTFSSLKLLKSFGRNSARRPMSAMACTIQDV